MTAANTAQVVLKFSQEGQVLNNVLAFSRFGGYTDEELITTAEEVIDWWDTDVKAEVAASASLVEVRVRSLETEDAPTFIITTDLPIVGTGGAGLPNSVTTVMSLHTPLAGRSRRGRIYHVGLRTNHLVSDDPNRVSDTSVANLINAYSPLMTPFGSLAGNGLAVYSRTMELSTDVNVISNDGVVDNQRRRLPGRGR